MSAAENVSLSAHTGDTIISASPQLIHAGKRTLCVAANMQRDDGEVNNADVGRVVHLRPVPREPPGMIYNKLLLRSSDGIIWCVNHNCEQNFGQGVYPFAIN
ncbi:predicted protein [Postia placenta Mad-698-R]|nr:predicted protein [Postia placenta Mad-698-R]